MSYTAKKLLAIAAAEIGYKEKETNSQLDNKTANAGDENYTKYARDLRAAGYYQASKQGFAWCDMFVDWCFLQLCGGDPDVAQKLICQSGPYGAGCKWSAGYYKDAGRFYTSNPQPGDQIFFNNYAHTGIVEKVEGGIVTTIEGNTSDQVARRTYSINSSSIDGYGRPKFATEASTPAAVTGTASTGTASDEKAIWDFFKGKGLNDFAVAGVMGNLYAESGLCSNNLQNSYQSKLGFTDATYTSAIDNGSYTKFANDAAGYGLAQWTYSTRKRNLLSFAKSAGKSIGDLAMQLDFLWKELQGYAGVMKVLKAAASVKDASDAFMCNFERPADQSTTAKNKRASYGQKYYDKYAAAASTTPAVSASELPSVGDEVNFTGTKHYVSSTSVNGKSCKPGKAKVTAIAKNGKHPVHLVRTSGGVSTVYGWVDLKDIAVISAQTHKVVRGDTLSGIALKYGTTVNAIAKANNIANVNIIRVGQVLTIPK